MSIDTTTSETETTLDPIGEPVTVPEQVVEVRRRALPAVVLGAGSSLVAIAYLARAAGSGGVLDWILAVVLGAIGVVNLAALLDARTPLLVADDLGVRLRLGRAWVGLPWGGIETVEHRPRRGWRDGLLAVRTHYVQRVLEDLDPAARRSARLNGRLRRTPLSVPLGLTTRVVGAEPDLTTALLVLADGRAAVVETPGAPVRAEEVDEVDEVDEIHDGGAAEAVEPATGAEIALTPIVASSLEEDLVGPGSEPEGEGPDEPRPLRLRDPRPTLARWMGVIAARADLRDRGDDEDLAETTDADDAPEDDDRDAESAPPPIVASATPEPARATVAAARVDIRHVTSEVHETPDDETQVWAGLPPLDEDEDVALAEPAVILDEHAAPLPEPVIDPVIGPVFAAARERLGLSVDQLAERTRIRPHVIEALEVDDFSACGGDFYARGHLRTLARVLGLDVAPLLETYDKRYADAPIDPRRVFEAELAGAGSIRATRGGPNWSVLVAAVMALILCWSVARLVTGGPHTSPERAILSGSAGLHHQTTPASPVAVRLTATTGGAHVVVRNGLGRVVFSGDLALGQSHRVQASPPVRVRSTDGGVQVTVAGHDRGRMGPAGRPASQTYVPHR